MKIKTIYIYITEKIKTTYIYIYIYIYIPYPFAHAGKVNLTSFFKRTTKGLNSEFSFQIGYHTKVKETSLLYLAIAGGRIKTLNSKPEEFFSPNLWHTVVPFFCYQLIQKEWLLLNEPCQLVCGCKIHELHLNRGVRPL